MAGLCEKFHRAVELIGARWSGAIVQVLMSGPVRYADLRAAVPDISDRMLCERLRELEDAGIVIRSVSQEPPVRVDYELSEKGRALQPALAAVGQWAEKWMGVTAPEGTKNEERRTKNDNAERRTKNGTKNNGTTKGTKSDRARASSKAERR
jgi:DNA-binding HxlR family transcriptional regulator